MPNEFERWRDDGWGLRIRYPSLEGQRKRLVAQVDVLQRCEAGEIHLRTTGEITPLNPKIAAGLLSTIDGGAALHNDLMLLSNEVRESLLSPHPESGENATSGRKPMLVQMSTVEPEDVEFLWWPYLPIGKLTIVEGDPGAGKTFLGLAISATVSVGGKFLSQDGEFTESVDVQNVVYMSAEDGLGDTLRKRLDGAMADVTRVYALTGWASEDESETGFATMQDLDVLRDMMEQVNPKLVIIDPLQAYLGDGVNMSRAEETRPVLAGLAGLAAEYQCAIVMIRHLSKAQQPQELYRGMGSIDFTAAARSVIAVGKDPEDKQTHVMVHLKHSLTPQGSSIAYTIADGAFKWIGKTEHTASDILSPVKRTDSDKNKLDEAIAFLLEHLGDGQPKGSAEVEKLANDSGIKKQTLRRARESLAKSHGLRNEKTGGVWIVKIPTLPNKPQDVQDAHLNKNPWFSNDEHLEHLPQVLENKEENQDVQDVHMNILKNDRNYLINQTVIQDVQDVHPHENHGENEKSADAQNMPDKFDEYVPIPTFDDDIGVLFEVQDRCPECGVVGTRRRGGMECAQCGRNW